MNAHSCPAVAWEAAAPAPAHRVAAIAHCSADGGAPAIRYVLGKIRSSAPLRTRREIAARE
ncbi:MAG: hypothetical protein M3323_12145 [Actinomycetota bacterium]|nr:hypothetical protein [Actinomycetota bacterium]